MMGKSIRQIWVKAMEITTTAIINVPLILPTPHVDSSRAAPNVVNSELSWVKPHFSIDKYTSKMLVRTAACVAVQGALTDNGLLDLQVLKAVAALQ